MAEGWLRSLKGNQYHVYSAGLEKHGLNPHAVKVMAEAGVDISGQHSKTLHELVHIKMDVVFTVCGHADETCPVFPNTCKKIHVGFDDPPKLAANAGSEQEALDHYRRVRDEIREFVDQIESYLDL